MSDVTKQVVLTIVSGMLVCCGISQREGHSEMILNPESSCGYSDKDSIDGSKVLSVVEKMPEYRGGMRHFHESIGRAIKLPADPAQRQSVIVYFVVDTTGRVRNVCIGKKSLTDSLTIFEKQALEAIRHHQDWIPGVNEGKKVPVKLSLQITAPR